MKAKEFIPASKPRNPVVRQQQTSGAGAHRDKKKEQKQGYEKHKGRGVSEGYTTEKQILTRIRQIMYDRKLSGTESNAGELLRLKQQLKDLRREQGVSEGTGVTDYDPKSKGGTRKELIARYHKTKDPKDAEAARKAGATQKELQGVAEGWGFDKWGHDTWTAAQKEVARKKKNEKQRAQRQQNKDQKKSREQGV